MCFQFPNLTKAVPPPSKTVFLISIAMFYQFLEVAGEAGASVQLVELQLLWLRMKRPRMPIITRAVRSLGASVERWKPKALRWMHTALRPRFAAIRRFTFPGMLPHTINICDFGLA